MTYLARVQYENEQKNYFRKLYTNYGEIPSNHAKAIDMRMTFFKRYILNRVSTIQILTHH
jgi:hypothetical protein